MKIQFLNWRTVLDLLTKCEQMTGLSYSRLLHTGLISPKGNPTQKGKNAINRLKHHWTILHNRKMSKLYK